MKKNKSIGKKYLATLGTLGFYSITGVVLIYSMIMATIAGIEGMVFEFFKHMFIVFASLLMFSYWFRIIKEEKKGKEKN
jgi:hypothetical protein